MCEKIQKDQIGERALFREGMSLVNLMHAYAIHQPFSNFTNWDIGYCLHSDWYVNGSGCGSLGLWDEFSILNVCFLFLCLGFGAT